MMKDEPSKAEIIQKYNETKQNYSIYFQKAIEIEQQLVEHNLVGNTLSSLESNRRCFRKIGGVLVEKDLVSVKKDLNIEISNIKKTLDVVYQSMKNQEALVQQFESKYGHILQEQQKKTAEKKEGEANKSGGGVLV